MNRRSCLFERLLTGGYKCRAPDGTDRPTWEEYRYDALGRRVLIRTSQKPWACDVQCVEAVTRTVWDGDQVLAEIRAPFLSAEQDTGRVVDIMGYEHGYGQVLCTHGPALDHPLLVTRLSYDTLFPDPIRISPHTNWQGQYDSGEIVRSSGGGSCRNISSGGYDSPPAGGGNTNGGEVTGPSFPDSLWTCIKVDWPAPYQWRTYLEHGRGKIGPPSWVGSLIEGGRDLTGQMYMRSRFYDPASGRFTQEDPIGIAGGLNVYGFGGGDPVTYADPYGLEPEQQDPAPESARMRGCQNEPLCRALVAHLEANDGRTMVLSKSTFEDVVYVAEHDKNAIVTATVPLRSRPGVEARVVSFYGTKYENAIGSATIYYQGGKAIGFHDTWDFDSLPWTGPNSRSFLGEVKTRLARLSLPADTKSLEVIYTVPAPAAAKK